MLIPSSLDWMRSDAAGREWLALLPERLEQAALRWDLTVAAPYEGGGASWVAPAVRRGEQVVVKLQFPHRESDDEAEALRVWDGQGAVRLIDHHEAEHALLLERCTPGTHLSAEGSHDALDVLCELLPQLWKPAHHGCATLVEEAASWNETLKRELEKPLPDESAALIHEALRIIEEMSPSSETVLLHQDLHGDNVILSERGWLVIDPKAVAGEREFAVAPIVRSSELGHSERDVVTRLDTLSERLELNRDRARLWTIVQTVAWGTWFTDPTCARKHADVARWLLRNP